RRGGEYGGRRAMGEQAGKVVPAVGGKNLVFRLRHEGVAALPLERLVQVPAAREVASDRGTAHERGEVAETPADLAGGGAQQHRVVGGAQCRLCRERRLDLAGTPFLLERAERQPELRVRVGERLEDR